MRKQKRSIMLDIIHPFVMLIVSLVLFLCNGLYTKFSGAGGNGHFIHKDNREGET